MSTRLEWDDTDRAILARLAADGRASYQAIADAVRMSRPAVVERVKRLEERGVITGYGAHLDRARLGYPVTAFVAVRYGQHDLDATEPLMRELVANPAVLECHHVAGEDCYILKVVAPDLAGVQGLLRTLTGKRRQITTRTTIVLGTLFEKRGVVPTRGD